MNQLFALATHAPSRLSSSLHLSIHCLVTTSTIETFCHHNCPHDYSIMLALSIAALALLALARPASAYPILAESDVVAFPISATCKAPFTLERFLPHTAVPRQFDHCLETLEPEGVGIYKDTGCGVGIVPNTTVPQVCARTVYNTTEGDAVWLGPCRAGDKLGTGGGDGGRWDMVLGDTLVRSMEAQTPD